MAFVAASILPFSSCSDFLDREPITKPEAGNFLTGAIQVENYINGLYMTLPSFSKFGLGVRSEEKNSDNIIAEKYDARLHGQNNQFSGASDWQTGYQNLRKVNYFFHNYKVPEAQENEDVLSLKGEAYFLRAYWHFDLLKKFGSIPVMDAFWDENATIAGLQIPAKTRNEVARFILSDLVEAKNLLHSRGKYSGIRINKEAAMVLAMNVALYEGTWEKYHSSDDFASSTNESNYFLGEVISWGNVPSASSRGGTPARPAAPRRWRWRRSITMHPRSSPAICPRRSSTAAPACGTPIRRWRPRVWIP